MDGLTLVLIGIVTYSLLSLVELLGFLWFTRKERKEFDEATTALAELCERLNEDTRSRNNKLKGETMSKLDDIAEQDDFEVGFLGDMDHWVKTKQAIKDLFLELVGEDESVKEAVKTGMGGAAVTRELRNMFRAELRQKIGDL